MDKKRIKNDYKSVRREIKSNYRERARFAKAQYRERLLEYELESGKPLPKNPPKRPVLEEIGNAVTHGVGALLAPIALILMLINSTTAREYVAAAVYSFGLLAMFLMSCLYHSFRHGSRVKRVFQRFDYCSIYILIGATFAPILLAYIGDAFGIAFFIVQWAIIAAGISLVGVFGPARLRKLQLPIYMVIGWSGLVFMPRIFSSDPGLAWWMLGGGAVYSLGTIPFALKRGPSHFIWHFFVLAGAIVQWIGVYHYIYLK